MKETNIRDFIKNHTVNGSENYVILEDVEKIVDYLYSKPWLGKATTKEIINELKAREPQCLSLLNKVEKRSNLKYKTSQ